MEPARIRVLIVSDVRLYRDGLAQILAVHECLHVVETAQDIDEAWVFVQRLTPDVVLLDMAFVAHLRGLRNFAELFGTTKIVALGVSGVEQDIVACAEQGISGFVFRDDSIEDLIATLKCAVREELRCTRRVSAMLLHRVAELAPNRVENEISALTRRELQVVQLIAEGLTNKQIAQRLFIEVSTVKHHVHTLCEKLRVHRRGEAVARLRAAGWPQLGSRPSVPASSVLP